MDLIFLKEYAAICPYVVATPFAVTNRYFQAPWYLLLENPWALEGAISGVPGVDYWYQRSILQTVIILGLQDASCRVSLYTGVIKSEREDLRPYRSSRYRIILHAESFSSLSTYRLVTIIPHPIICLKPIG